MLPAGSERETQMDDVIKYVRSSVDLETGDYVAITFGDVVGVDGHTNSLKILKVD